MKPGAWLAGWVIFLAMAGVAGAQGARGFAGAGRGMSGGGHSGTVVVPAPQGPSNTQGVTRFRQNPPTVVAPGGAMLAPRPFPGAGGIFAPPHPAGRPPGFVLGLPPHHLHTPWFFRHHPGVVIIEVPAFFDDSTVITQYVPEVVQADRPFTEESPTGVPTRTRGQLAPFDPTPHEVVERMLALAKIKKTDVVYDLGAGDGRIVIAAAKKYGVRAVGFEIDPGLAKLARENARRAGVNKLVEIRQQDFLTADLSPASVVTLYLSYDGNLAVRPQLIQQLKRDARVVSYTFDMGDWQPKIAETFRDSEGNSHQLYLWQIGEPMLFSDAGPQILQPQPLRKGPLIIDIK